MPETMDDDDSFKTKIVAEMKKKSTGITEFKKNIGKGIASRKTARKLQTQEISGTNSGQDPKLFNEFM